MKRFFILCNFIFITASWADQPLLKIEKVDIDRKTHAATFKLQTQDVYYMSCKEHVKLYQKDDKDFVQIKKSDIPDSPNPQKDHYLNGKFVEVAPNEECIEPECVDAEEELSLPVKLVRYEQLPNKSAPEGGKKVQAFRSLPIFGKFRADFVNFYIDADCKKPKRISHEFELPAY